MDRLVKPDVKEVEILFKKGQKSTTTFRLTNLMHTMSVAVSLTTTNPSVFSFNRSFSIIPPLSSSSYTLILSQPSDQPPLCTPFDVITVQAAMLPTGKAHADDLRRLFSRPGPHVFKDAIIPISLVGPLIAEYIITNHVQIADELSHFNRAISGCTRSQLTALLESAVMSGAANLVARLIDVGSDVNFKDSEGRSMITTAIKAGKLEVVKLLVDSGCEIDGLVDKVLHEAAAINRVDMMDVLSNRIKDLNVDSTDLHGRAPIHVAAICGHIEMIKFCASIGGKTDVVDCNGCTLLHLAAGKGHLEVVEWLLDSSDCCLKHVVNKEGKTAFDVAVDNGNSHLYGVLKLGDLLHRAARLGDANGIKRCIADGANVNERDQNGWTPLHRAAFKGKIESVEVLVNHGARVDVVDDAGYTPLHCAVEAEHVKVALLLISNGAEANLKSLKFDKNKNCHSLFKKQFCDDEKEQDSLGDDLSLEFSSSCVL